MVEPVQGEGGVNVAPAGWLKALRELCDKHGLLLVLDEVQTGMGRTGTLFAYEGLGFKPDVMAVAKGLGGGFPIGAVLATKDAAKGMVAGTHGSTFGGNPRRRPWVAQYSSSSWNRGSWSACGTCRCASSRSSRH